MAAHLWDTFLLALVATGGGVVAASSGASMNPVRSFAPDLVRGDLSTTWIYLLGPVLEALLGVAFEWLLRRAAYRCGSTGGARLFVWRGRNIAWSVNRSDSSWAALEQ